MIPRHTKALLGKCVAASLNDAAEVLRRAEIRQAELNQKQGRFGQAAEFAQIKTVYNEYQRRAEAILDCIRNVLKESSFRYYRKLDNDLREFFLEQCSACSSDIEAKLRSMSSGGKPTFPDFKRELHEKLLAEVSLAAESYLTHHKEVVRSLWVAYGRKFIWWVIGSIGLLVLTLIGSWLTKRYID